MNPTDQARKVARKKELKRNKKLRQAVRAASIKGRMMMVILAMVVMMTVLVLVVVMMMVVVVMI